MKQSVRNITNKVSAVKDKVTEDTKEFNPNDVKVGNIKRSDSKYVTGAKTHPQYFDEMTPELISALDRPTLK